MVHRELDEWEEAGFMWYGIQFLISLILLIVVHVKESSKKYPKYGLVTIKETFLLLRLCTLFPFCSILLGLIYYAIYLPPPREDLLAASIGIRDTNTMGLYLFNGLTFLAFLLVLNPYVLARFARNKFTPLLPTSQELSQQTNTPLPNLQACVVSVWNGMWPAQLAKRLKGVRITLADTWENPTNRDALRNLEAEGIPNDLLNPVKTPFTQLAFANEQFDLVFGAASLNAVEDPEDKERLIEEMYRILKPAGRFYLTCHVLNQSEGKKYLEKVGFVVVSKTTCWPTFFPVVLIHARKSTSGPAANTRSTDHMLKLDSNLQFNTNNNSNNYNNNNARSPASINALGEGDVNVHTPLLADKPQIGERVFAPPPLPSKYKTLRSLLIFGLFIFEVLYLVVLTIIWPHLDYPKAILDYNRFTSGFLLPFAQPFALILVDTWDEIREFATKPVSKESLVKYFLKRVAIGQIASFAWNMITWLPSMCIDLYMATHNVDENTASLINMIVVSLLLYISIKVSRKLAARKKKRPTPSP